MPSPFGVGLLFCRERRLRSLQALARESVVVMLGRGNLQTDEGQKCKHQVMRQWWLLEDGIARIIGNGVGFAVRSPVYNDLVVVEGAVSQPLGPQLAKC